MTARGRLITVLGALLLLLGVNAPPGGKPQTVFVVLLALPLLLLPLTPRTVWQRAIGFNVGYTAVLTPLVGIMLLLNGLAPLWLAIWIGSAAALTSNIIDSVHSPRELRGDLFVLGLVGVLYFPGLYGILHTLYTIG